MLTEFSVQFAFNFDTTDVSIGRSRTKECQKERKIIMIIPFHVVCMFGMKIKRRDEWLVTLCIVQMICLLHFTVNLDEF